MVLSKRIDDGHNWDYYMASRDCFKYSCEASLKPQSTLCTIGMAPRLSHVDRTVDHTSPSSFSWFFAEPGTLP